jgi:DNA polymerase, archaea type
MIINSYRPDLDSANNIYKRWRDNEGTLIQEHIEDYKPYFYIRSATPERIIDKVLSRYPGSHIDKSITYTALRTEESLYRVYVYLQSDIRNIQGEFGKTWEADLSLVDRYLIDNVPVMPDWKPRVWHFDLEWDPKEKFTTVMSVVDNYNERNVVFCWSEVSAEEESDDKGFVRKEIRLVDQTDELGNQFQFNYERFFYADEKSMHEAFLCYLEECNPDILVAHAMMWADLPHLVERLDDFRRLSPLGRVIRPRKNERGYKYTDQPIIGRLCFDTAAPLESGTGFERVWKDTGNPQLSSRKLDHICGPDVLGYGGKMEMDVFTGWYERFDDFCDYCMHDTRLLKRMDEENHVLGFFLSLQRLCGVSFSSSHNVTRFARGLLGRRTEWKAPTRTDKEKREYEGAFIPPPNPGRYEGVAVVDYKGLYPSLILSHNLSWETQVDKSRGGDDNVHRLPDGTCWEQRDGALLPNIVTEMFELRDKYKGLMKAAQTSVERSGWNTMQLAVKRVMASLYGMVASPHWGWCDFDIASAITACGREAIKFLMEESTAQGYEAIYGHTDSAFVAVPFDEVPALAQHLTEQAQIQLNAKDLVVEFEAYMPYWLIAGKNLYYGICSWPPEDKGKAKAARFGKISTLAPVSRNLERDVLDMICTGASEGDVIDYVRPIALNIQRGEIDISSITGVTRIQKKIDGVCTCNHKATEDCGGKCTCKCKGKQYRASTGVAGVKGARYYNEFMARKFDQPEYGEGDSVPWVYVNGVPNWGKPVDIVAYRDISDLEGFSLNWEIMTDKLIKQKIKPIFNALQWDLEAASGAARPKRYW